MLDEYDMEDNFEFDDSDEEFAYDDVEDIQSNTKTVSRDLLKKMPMFQALFQDAVGDDLVLSSFAEHVVGELSNRFALKAAKGGAFFQARQDEGLSHAHRFEHDQNLRAHLINGMLPVLRIARQLHAWDAEFFEDWDETCERLFVAGYMLHDFTKIEAVQQTLRDEGFYDGEAPSERQMPVLEQIFRDWCANLGLDHFLESVGGTAKYVNELIYIACNTQRMKGTARAPFLYRQRVLDSDRRDVLTELSRLADLMAYVAKSPRDVVANETIRKLIAMDLTSQYDAHRPVARFVYHHVAENRGLLLNFIHNGVVEAISNEMRVPLLYAPSGVVYLEHHDAPELPEIDDIIAEVVSQIRTKSGDKLISTGKGAKRGNTFLQIDDSYNDFFSMSEMILNSTKLISRYIRSNKTPSRFDKMREYQWTGWDNIPANYPTDATDARADQIAEWGGFVETQYRDRVDADTTNVVRWLLQELGVPDLEDDFTQLKSEATRGGLRYWWHWIAAHVLNVQSSMDDVAVRNWLNELSKKFVAQLPADLPSSADINQDTWLDLSDYVKRVLTVSGVKSISFNEGDELNQYAQSKVKRGIASCAMCGSDYPTRRPAETAVAFQPGVYTGRIGIGASNNKRNLCSICATEQLLRQLFLENLDTGSKAESQKIRYLSFYPSYFFSPETLRIVQRAYSRIKSIRLSDSAFWRVLREQDDLTDVTFWQRLDEFFMYPHGESDASKFPKVLRYSENAQSTYFTVGFRNLDPTDTESWVLPTLLSFVMSICLDVKVVTSDSGIPLMLESTELPETLWFDGLHPSIQQLIAVRVSENGEKSIEARSKMDIDSMSLALARLTAAYLIHLDSEYSPPKENWQRFTPIANALCESPLYVFHYLKKQERDDRPLTRSKIKRYLQYAELFNIQGDKMLNYAKELAELYHTFYKVNSPFRASSYNLTRPVDIVANALLHANPDLFSNEALVGLARGQLKDRLDSSETKAFVIRNKETEANMKRFCELFVNDIFIGVFNKDTATLRGKQLSLLRATCEIYYLDAVRREWADRDETEDSDDN